MRLRETRNTQPFVRSFLEVEMLNVIHLLLGSALLLAGRKLFWLFVGAAGFVTGIQLTTRVWQGSDLLAVIVGLVIGLIFAFLAITLQGLLIGIAGFLLGIYILGMLAAILGIDLAGPTAWMAYGIGGVAGLVLVGFLFDWALITLSSLAGASLIVQGLFPQPAAGGILFFLLFIAGILMQGALLRRQTTSRHGGPS